jgi:ribosomal protein L11 methyltransferase
VSVRGSFILLTKASRPLNNQPSQDKRWYALDVGTEPGAQEAVEYALMEAGALGTETNGPGDQPAFVVTGYFNEVPNREQVRAELAEALRIYELPSSAVLSMDAREVADEDWLGEWKKNWQPVETGRFIIAPPWSEIPSSDRIVIRIEPGMAFGTGTHETTRLCLMAIEKHFNGSSFLDVGTGAGILAIAAAKLFPTAKVDACDNDPAAIEIAQENARLNEVANQIVFEVSSVDATTPSADFVCANLTADVIIELMPGLVDVSCGRLVLSGILETQIDSVVDRLHECGIANPIETMVDGEWAALII